MELTYDWHGFQSMFYPKRRVPASAADEPAGAAYLVIDTPERLEAVPDRGEAVILSTYCDGEDYSDWVGHTVSEMAVEVTHRELVLFERKDVDSWMDESLELPHFYDQIEHLRLRAASRTLTRDRGGRGASGAPASLTYKDGAKLDVQRHFLLEALQSGAWSRLLPSSYGLFISLQKGSARPAAPARGQTALIAPDSQNLFVVIRRGRVDLFCEPELSSLGKERCRQPLEIARYLSEKYLVPVQGVMAQADEWKLWSESENPWRQIAFAIRSHHVRLYPFRWNVVTLIATRGILGL